MKTKALLFTQGSGGEFEPVPFELYKKDFNPSKYPKSPLKFYSKVLNFESTNMVMGIEGVNVFALAFSDGTICDTTGWRNGEAKEWVNKIYKEKTCQSV